MSETIEIHGGQLQKLMDAKVFKGFRNYIIASCYKGHTYKVSGSKLLIDRCKKLLEVRE